MKGKRIKVAEGVLPNPKDFTDGDYCITTINGKSVLICKLPLDGHEGLVSHVLDKNDVTEESTKEISLKKPIELIKNRKKWTLADGKWQEEAS